MLSVLHWKHNQIYIHETNLLLLLLLLLLLWCESWISTKWFFFTKSILITRQETLDFKPNKKLEVFTSFMYS